MKIWEYCKKILSFINQYFKAIILILVLLFIFLPTAPKEAPTLMRIDLTGVIQDASSVLNNIQIAKNTDSIKGVLLYVDSPGGSVAPSIEISLAIKDLTKTKKVIAYAAGTMASGSYYAASTSDFIIANPGSMIGSIGVIASVPNIEELSKKIGISEQVVKAGKYKEAGTMTRAWTKEERDSLQETVDDIYDLFVNDVIKARNMNGTKVEEFANARVFIASKAKQIGLIDAVGGVSDAQDYLAKSANVTEVIWQEPDIIEKIANKIGVEIKSQMSQLLYGIRVF